MHPERVKELLIIFAEDEIKLTHVPMASLYNEDLSFNFNNVESKDIPAITSGKICPFAKQLSGRDDICCRYISKYWNY